MSDPIRAVGCDCYFCGTPLLRERDRELTGCGHRDVMLPCPGCGLRYESLCGIAADPEQLIQFAEKRGRDKLIEELSNPPEHLIRELTRNALVTTVSAKAPEGQFDVSF